jgi:hypothetical protein
LTERSIRRSHLCQTSHTHHRRSTPPQSTPSESSHRSTRLHGADAPGPGGDSRGWVGLFSVSILEPPLARQARINEALVNPLTHNQTPSQEITRVISYTLALRDDDTNLKAVVLPDSYPPELVTLAETFNKNVGKINTHHVRLRTRYTDL